MIPYFRKGKVIMCGQCAFLKENDYREGNGGGKKYYCEYLRDYTCGSDHCCAAFKKNVKRSADNIEKIITDGKNYDNGIPAETYFFLVFLLLILGLILGVFK